MKDSPKFLYIHIILLIKLPSNFPIYPRDSPNFYTYKSRGFLKSSLPCTLLPLPFVRYHGILIYQIIVLACLRFICISSYTTVLECNNTTENITTTS